MRYLQAGGFRNHPLMRLTLGATLVMLTGLWFTNALLYLSRMSLDPASVVRYYRGSEAEFIEPRTYGSMLEVTHVHLPMMAFVALLLTHLAIFLPWPNRWRVTLIVTTFGSALAGEAASWLVRFGSPAWAPLKVAAFVTLQVSLAALLLGLAVYLFLPGRRPAGAPTSAHDGPVD
jgi:hypothetical protein